MDGDRLTREYLYPVGDRVILLVAIAYLVVIWITVWIVWILGFDIVRKLL